MGRESWVPVLRIFGAMSVLAIGAIGLVRVSEPETLALYLGEGAPVLKALLVCLAGLATWAVFLRGPEFRIHRTPSRKGFALAILASVVFGAVIITLDLMRPFPEDIAMPPPGSLLFYPAIGVIAEVVFHLVPLALFTLVLGAFPATSFRRGPARSVIALILAALAEPAFQVVLMNATGQYPPAVLTVVGVHVFLFSLVQLILFRRWGFTVMYAMRLAYYLIWHIAWGWWRLDLLF